MGITLPTSDLAATLPPLSKKLDWAGAQLITIAINLASQFTKLVFQKIRIDLFFLRFANANAVAASRRWDVFSSSNRLLKPSVGKVWDACNVEPSQRKNHSDSEDCPQGKRCERPDKRCTDAANYSNTYPNSSQKVCNHDQSNIANARLHATREAATTPFHIMCWRRAVSDKLSIPIEFIPQEKGDPFVSHLLDPPGKKTLQTTDGEVKEILNSRYPQTKFDKHRRSQHEREAWCHVGKKPLKGLLPQPKINDVERHNHQEADKNGPKQKCNREAL